MTCTFAGRFGWDKDRHWTAWPVEMTAGNIGLAGGSLGSRPAIPEQNLARGKPALASSSLEGHGAQAALDGRNSTFWQPAADDPHPAWTVDLKTAVSLSGVRMIFSGGPGYRPPTIEVSDDQKTWRTVPDSSGPASGAPGNPIMLTASIRTTARFVRLVFPASAPGGTSGRSRTRGSLGTTIELSEVAVEGALTDVAATTAPGGTTQPAGGAAADAAPVITAAVVGGAPAMATAAGDTQVKMEDARTAVQWLALKSPNPYVREMAYHQHDGDWSFDLKKGTFSVKIAELQNKIVTGTLRSVTPNAVIVPEDQGPLGQKILQLLPADSLQVAAAFDDEGALSRDWIVPADAVLTEEEAGRCLAVMGGRMADANPYDANTRTS